MADLKNALGILGALTSPTFTYAPEDIQIILHTAAPDGTTYEHLVNGYADGTFIQITRDEQVFKSPTQLTMDGRTQRLLKLLQSMYTINITLTQTSISNSQIQQLAHRDVQTVVNNGTAALQSISIKDIKSTMIIGPIPVWVEAYPVVTYASGLETRQWTLKAFGVDDDLKIRGNQSEFEFTGLLGGLIGGATGLIGAL